MTEATQIAIVGTISVIVAPAILAWLTARNARQAKQQDYARQDELALEAAEIAERLEKKTDQIHTLVNSEHTRQMESSLAALKSLVVLLSHNGASRTKAARGVLEATKIQIVALEKRIAEQKEATAIAAAELVDGKPPKEAG